jgi:hypothetical protein
MFNNIIKVDLDLLSKDMAEIVLKSRYRDREEVLFELDSNNNIRSYKQTFQKELRDLESELKLFIEMEHQII